MQECLGQMKNENPRCWLPYHMKHFSFPGPRNQWAQLPGSHLLQESGVVVLITTLAVVAAAAVVTAAAAVVVVVVLLLLLLSMSSSLLLLVYKSRQ